MCCSVKLGISNACVLCSLVMSLFSCDYIKTEIESISNVLTCLQVYSTDTVPGF